MSRVRVDLHRLERLVDEMRVVQEQLGRVRAEVDARVEQLQPSWTGAAAAAQLAAQAWWSAGAAEVHEALAVLHSIGATAHANYAAAVQANRRMWAR